MNLDFMVTLCPSFTHFPKFAQDDRISGIRLNSAMLTAADLDQEVKIASHFAKKKPLYFDIKGRQLRITDVIYNPDNLELKLNHPIKVKTPCPVLFKAGADHCMLDKVVDGNYLIFDGGPYYNVKPGESICIRDKSLVVGGPTYTDAEKDKISKVYAAGFRRYFLSYAENQRDIDELRDYIGDSELVLKIESKLGLKYVLTQWKKSENTSLMAARGDLYVEIDKPHQILACMRMIIGLDPEAIAGSRILLSLVQSSVPECCDLSELAWLHDIGYRRMLLCDELCLKGDLLGRAINVLEAFRENYAKVYQKNSGLIKELYAEEDNSSG